MNKKQKGHLAEAKILANLLELDYTVLQPFGDNEKYDLVIESERGFHRIQCKYGKYKENGSINVQLNSSRINMNGQYKKTYTKEDIDYFATWCQKVNEVFLFSVDECGTRSFTIRLEKPKNNQSKGVNLAKNYLLENYEF